MKAFAEISWLDYPKIFYQRIKDEILSNGKDYILKVDEEEYPAAARILSRGLSYNS